MAAAIVVGFTSVNKECEVIHKPSRIYEPLILPSGSATRRENLVGNTGVIPGTGLDGRID